MSNEFRIAIGIASGTSGQTWNSVNSTVTNAALTYWDGTASTATVTAVAKQNGSNNVTPTGDAAWAVGGAPNFYWYVSSGAGTVTVNVGVGSGLYTVKTFSWRGEARGTNISVNSELVQTVSTFSAGEIALFTGIAPDANGDLVISYAVGASGFGYLNTINIIRTSDAGPSEAYVLTDHGTPQANSTMEGNQFATTGPVYFDITGGDTNIANPDWPSINAAQLWLTNINDIAAFNPVAVGSVTYTIAYRVSEGGATGTFQRTVNVVASAVIAANDNWRFFVAATTAPKTWEWGNRHPTTNARVRLFKGGGS
jgi:hypothetical protein